MTTFPKVAKHVDIKKTVSGALSGKLLLVRIVENNIIDAYFRAG